MKLYVTVHKLTEIKVSGRLEKNATASYSLTNAACDVTTLHLSLQSSSRVQKRKQF